MVKAPLVAIEVMFSFLAIGWGVWELIALRRDKKRSEAEHASKAAPVQEARERESG